MKTVGLLVCAFAQCASAAEPPTPIYVWDVPQPLEAVDVPERIEAGGVPVAIHAVRSKASPAELVDSFRAQFKKRGLFLPPDAHLKLRALEPQLTGLDPETFIAYTIFLQPNGDGTTTALMTETFLAERRTAADDVDFAPVMPGAKQVLQSRTEGLRVVTYRADATEDEAWDFHRQVLAEAKFEEREPGTFQRKGEVLHVTVRPESSGGVWISVMQQPSAELPRQSPLALEEPTAP